MTTTSRLRLGTRGSALARWQADWVAERLGCHGVEVEMILISTRGDVKSGPIGAIGGEGVFTKEIQRALLDRRIDLAVHSLKDLPTEPVDGLCLAAVPERESPADVLVSPKAHRVEELPRGAKVGTGSARRRAQLLHARGDLIVEDVRGNVETRLRMLDEGRFDAVVLAEAGLKRLGLDDRIGGIIPRSIMLPAVGQGALGLESRRDDDATREAVGRLDHPPTHHAVVAERAMLAALRGGCLAPVGAWGRVSERGVLELDGVVLSDDGSRRMAAAASGDPASAAAVGREAARKLIAQGADRWIQASRNFS